MDGYILFIDILTHLIDFPVLIIAHFISMVNDCVAFLWQLNHQMNAIKSSFFAVSGDPGGTQRIKYMQFS